eukprot:64424_1
MIILEVHYRCGAHYPKDVPANRFEVYRSTQPISLFDDYLAIGAYGDNSRATDSGSVYVFNKNNDGTWSQSAKLTAADGGIYDYFGSAVSLFDDYLAIGAYGDNSRAVDSGSVYVFNKNNNGTWSQSVKLTAADGGINDYFGSALSLFDDYLAIGAYGDNSRAVDSGSVYVFNKNNDGTWSQSAKLTAADGGINDYFGSALSLFDDYLAIGAYCDSSRAAYSGSVYVFNKNNDGTWSQSAKLTADDGGINDYFGSALSLFGDYLAIGAYGDSSRATNSGSVYVF